MLTYLRVHNLGLIEDAEMEPDSGLTVITGETGTGKTLLLGALRLLVGDKPVPSAVGPFGEASSVDGVFERDGTEIGVARKVPSQGRSRAFLEGRVVSASVLSEEISQMVVIAGQHEHVRLGAGAGLLGLVDGLVDDREPEARTVYRTAFERLSNLRQEQGAIGGDTIALNRELDLIGHQLAEIGHSGIDDLDDAAVETMASRLRNLDAIRSEVGEATIALQAIAEQIGSVVAATRRLAEVDAKMSDDAETAVAMAEQVGDLGRSLAKAGEDLAAAQADRAAIEQTLNQIGELKRKYGRTLAEVKEFRDGASARGTALEGLIERAGAIDAELASATDEMGVAASRLHQARVDAAGAMVDRARGHLADLGLKRARLEIVVEQTTPNRTGGDSITLRFSSDERLAPGPVGTVASGGELSRLVLALRLASGPDASSTLVFDEADAGIGGRAALALGEKLATLARDNQVIVVTHLPQIAAHADLHYVVDRSEKGATVVAVDGENRLVELSRMLAGLPDSPGGREAASELLAAAGRTSG